MPHFSLWIFKEFYDVYAILPDALRRRALRVFGCIFLLAIFEVLSILSLSFLAMSIAAPETIMGHAIVRRLFLLFPSLAALCADVRFFCFIAALSVVVLTIAKNAISAFVSLQTTYFGENIAFFAGDAILSHYLYSPYLWHLTPESGACINAANFKEYLGSFIISLMNVYTYAAISCALFIILISATPLVIIMTIGCTAAIAVAIYLTIKKRLDAASNVIAKKMACERSAHQDAVNGIREILMYNQQAAFHAQLNGIAQSIVAPKAFLELATSIPSWVLESVGFAVIPATLGVLILFHDAPMERIAGVLTMIMLAAWRILPLVTRSLACLINVRATRGMAMACLEQLQQIRRHPACSGIHPAVGFSVARDVSFSRARFRYPHAAHDTLEDVSLTLTRGMRLGVIGASGAGKSTFVMLLSGLASPTHGAMTVDGRALSPEELAAYRMKIGYIPQNPYILPGTVAANVAFSAWGKAVREDKVVEVCRMAALDVIDTHKRGMYAPVGERGAGFSGGQIQRITIARALYAEPDILIMDEATSSLDAGTERAIMETVYTLPQKMTIVIIAHRLTTVEPCDHLLWLDGGRIVAQGPPGDILPRYNEAMRRLTKTGCI